MKTLVPLILILLTAACQSPNHWQAPEGDETATLIFTSNRVVGQPLICRPGEGFVPTPQALAATPADPAPFDSPDGDQPGRVRASLPADQSVVVAVRFPPRDQASGRRPCRASARFTPAPGGHYRADFIMPGGHCGLSITDKQNRAVASTGADQPSCP